MTPQAVAGAVDDDIRKKIDAFGFDANVHSTKVGDAVALKLLRSIIIEGMESLLVECHQASESVGQTDKSFNRSAVRRPFRATTGHSACLM